MADPEPDLDAYAANAAALLRLPVAPDWAGGVVANLRVLMAAFDLVAGFPLPDEAEAAPVFTA
jgi:hypothetical protein